ncbi:amino acid ABC transporter permease [Candidatus Bipolaricaulota bacterium]|nr:amino acid ABC transporter permease [Candidatus Bipolaricaulota bacterium]MBS3791105.1 amino acid ABC transporter permease [Candidatus Bipolaricaulota bacterium]
MPTLLQGTIVTLELTFFSLLLGFLIGLPLAVGQVYGQKVVTSMISFYERVVRSVPLLVILMLVFYGLPWIGLNLPPFLAAVIGIGVRSSAYQSQIFRGAIQSIKSGQLLAARSIGLSRVQAIRYITIPQALRRSIPPWANEFTIVLKDTPLAYALGVVELLREGRYIIYSTFKPMVVFISAALIYFVLTRFGNSILEYVDKKLKIPGYETGRRMR